MADAPQATAVNRKSRVGTVVSDRNDKTIVVSIERATRHRLYRKVLRRRKQYHVHDAENSATVGDLVRIEECRPISKLKRWQLVEVLTERAVTEIAPESIDSTLVDEMQRTAARAAAEQAAEAGETAPEASSEAASDEPAGDEPAGDEATGEETVAHASSEALDETADAEPAAGEAESDSDEEQTD